MNSKVKPLGIRQPKRPVPKPTKPKAVINIDDIIDFIIKARPQTLITENYSISIFEKMQGSGSRKGVTKIIAVDSIDNSWAFKGDDHEGEGIGVVEDEDEGSASRD